MRLPDVYGYGSLFAFSGIDVENSHDRDLVAVTMPGLLTLRFDGTVPVTLRLPLEGRSVRCVLPDAIAGTGFLVAFAEKETVIGEADVPPSLCAAGDEAEMRTGGGTVVTPDGAFALVSAGGRFALARGETPESAKAKAQTALSQDPQARLREILRWYESLPACPDPAYERLYYKCAGISRVNVYSPQNGIPCRFTTPDRLPHRHMWLWDSMFHAMAIVRYDPALAKDAVRAVLACQRADGFIPHMMKSRTDVSGITQPPVVAWALLEIWKRTRDRDFLRECAPKAAAFLRWFLQNRDRNGDGLPEWDMNFDSVRCRCDESGMDNSPRFDVTEYVDAIDAASFLIHDCGCLAAVFAVLGEEGETAFFRDVASRAAAFVNDLLWDETVGAYTDRTFSGRLTGVLTPASFLPLFAGFCPPDRAEKLVALLRDPEKFATPFPVPSVSADDPAYGSDMWRGGVWLNYNYFIIRGLRENGYAEDADTLRRRTLAAADRWYRETGAVFEFYDPEDRTAPWFLPRKGPQPSPPDCRVKLHAITDYNWSASFLMLMLLGD